MADFSHWELAETFTSREAAYLLMGVDPSGPDIDRRSARHIEERIERAYEGAIARAEFEGFVEPSFPFEDAPEPEKMPEHAVLRSNALWMQIEMFREHGDCSSFSSWLQYQGGRNIRSQVFSRSELARWVKENGLKSGYRFDSKSPDATTKNDNTSAMLQAENPLGTRERNTLLAIIAALCNEAKIDHTKPSKAADYILSTADKMGLSISKRGIEEHLKKIPDMLASRMK